MNCYQCQHPAAEGQAFCDRCGARLIPDRAMIDAAWAGDQLATADLYTMAYDGVYYTIHAMIRDEDTVLDLVQDSFIRGFENLNRLQDPARFRPWMKAIARNKAIDELRSKKPMLFSQMVADDSEEVLDFEDDRPENLPEVVIDRQETARLVREILDSLPEDQRMVVALYYYEQLSVRQIAQKLGLNENTVKSRLSLARKKIENRVRSLERQGTRLYSLTPTAFLLLLLRQQSQTAPPVSPDLLLNGVLETLARDGAAKAATATGRSVTAKAVTATGRSAAAKAVTATGRSAAAKVIAIVTAVAVAGGGGVAAAHLIRERREAAEPTPIVESYTPEEAASGTPVEVLPGAPAEVADPFSQSIGRWESGDGSAELWIQTIDAESVTFSLYVPGRGSINNAVAVRGDGEAFFTYEDAFFAGHYASGSLTSDWDGNLHLALREAEPDLGAMDFTFPVRSSEPDYETLYAPVLEAYLAHEQSGGGLANYYGDGPGYVHVGLSGISRFGYLLWDLDGNGTPELILGALYTDADYAEGSWLEPDGYYANLIVDLFTLQDSSPVYVTNSGDRYRYNLTTQGQIYYEGSGGAAYSSCYLYRLNGAELELTDGLCIDGGEDSCYRVLDPEDWQHKNDQHISYEEYSQRVEIMMENGRENLGLIQPWLKPVSEWQAAAPVETAAALLPPYADVVQTYANLQVLPRSELENWSYANPPTYDMLERRYSEFRQDEPFEPYYALYDTNGDGTPELFIGLKEQDGSISLAEVYSTDGARAYRIAVGGFRRNLLGSGKILVEGGEFFPMGEMLVVDVDGHSPVQLLYYASGCDDRSVPILPEGEEPDFYYEVQRGYQSEHYPFFFLNESMAAGMRPAEELLDYQRIQPDAARSGFAAPAERSAYDGMLERYVWYLNGVGGANGLDEDMVRLIDARRGFAYAYFDGDCDGTEELYLGFPFGQDEHLVICYHVDGQGILHFQQAARFTGEEMEFTRAPWRWAEN